MSESNRNLPLEAEKFFSKNIIFRNVLKYFVHYDVPDSGQNPLLVAFPIVFIVNMSHLQKLIRLIFQISMSLEG